MEVSVSLSLKGPFGPTATLRLPEDTNAVEIDRNGNAARELKGSTLI
jgi:hypothetical protein